MVAIFLFSGSVYGKPNETVYLEKRQVECIQTAYRLGKKIELYGDTWGYTAAAIAYQESHCNSSKWHTNGVIVGDKDRYGRPKSLGIMQVQVPTAREINKHYPFLFENQYGDKTPTDDEIAVDLLIYPEFNIIMGVHYIAHLLQYRGGDWEFAILSYNRGTGHNLTDVNDYVRKVKHWIKTVIRPVIRGNYVIIERK